jgi:putative membrane protein
MTGLLIRMLVTALGLWLASALVPGMQAESAGTLLLAALLLGIVNAVVRPLVIILTFPITVVTLGLFLLVVNAGMLGLVGWLLEGLRLSGFWAALFGSLIVSATAMVASWYIGPRGRIRLIVVDRQV